MAELFQGLADNLVDFLIYAAIALVEIIALVKCVFPLRRSARCLRRAIHQLEMSPSGSDRPVWQDVMFLGKDMQGAWRRFLNNAEQLDARGLNCDVSDYINDDSAIYATGHVHLSEITPSLLTSLGILGTFIGLVRGLGSLDVSDAAKTMESIPTLIGGMTFAFATSIAGVACSLAFNMIHRMATGSATSAIDDFQEAFSEIVMQKPLDEGVQVICQQEDRAAFLRRAIGDIASRVGDGVTQAVERSLTPVTQSMNHFVLGQTQTQVEGLSAIVQQFIGQLNHTLNGQLLQLGQTLAALNQAQTVSYDSLQRTMASSEAILDSMQNLQELNRRVMERFEGYINAIDDSQHNAAAFLTHGSQVLSGMMTASGEQGDLLLSLKNAQQDLSASMKDYAAVSAQMMDTVQKHQSGTAASGQKMAKSMEESGKMLSESYASFVENISVGLSRTLGLFDKNMDGVMTALNQKLDELKVVLQASPTQMQAYHDETEGCITAMSKLQTVLTDLTQAVEAAKKGSEVA